MKFVKRLALDRKDQSSNRFAVEADDRIVTTSKRSLQLPKGARTDGRPHLLSPVAGQIRYSTTVNEIEAYVNGSWETIRTVRQGTITPQSLGIGNYVNSLFGPLSYDVDTTKPQNVMVYVDNVYQLPTTNYILKSGTSVAEVAQTTNSTGINQSTIILNTTTNVLVGETVSAASGISVGTTVTNVDVITRTITINPNTNSIIPAGTDLTFSYQSGTFVNFTGSVPAKQVFVLLGVDGYYPPFNS
jgi:hypothetical protein